MGDDEQGTDAFDDEATVPADNDLIAEIRRRHGLEDRTPEAADDAATDVADDVTVAAADDVIAQIRREVSETRRGNTSLPPPDPGDLAPPAPPASPAPTLGQPWQPPTPTSAATVDQPVGRSRSQRRGLAIIVAVVVAAVVLVVLGIAVLGGDDESSDRGAPPASRADQPLAEAGGVHSTESGAAAT